MNHNDVLNRFKEVNVSDTFGTKKEIKELPKVLSSDEEIMYATSGFVDGNTWLITCTNKRILFLDKGMIYGLKQVEIPIEKINSISHKTGLIFGKLIVHHGSSEMVITNINKNTLSPMINALNAEIDKKREQTNNNQSSPSSVADEILKFKQLLDQGIISEEEFQAKKKNLLGL